MTVTELHPGPKAADTFDPLRTIWVLDNDDLDRLLTAIRVCDEVVIDLETSGLNEHETGLRRTWPVPAKISLGSLTLPCGPGEPDTYVLPLAHPDSPWSGTWRRIMRHTAETIREAGKPIVNQHLKFDLRWIFAHTGIDLSPQFSWDTMYGSHLLDETQTTALKPRAAREFGIDRWDDHDLSTPGAALRVPLFDLGAYAARDTYWTWKLAVRQRRRMNIAPYGPALEPGDLPETSDEAEEWRLGKLAVYCDMPKGSTLTAMEQRGLRLDRQWVAEAIDAQEQIRHERFAELVGRYDTLDVDPDADPSFAPTSKWFRAWADAAVRAGDLRVMQTTKEGNPQWTKSILRRHTRIGLDLARELLEYRDAAKKLEFLRSWLDVVSRQNRIHATYWAGRVVTGRLSCSDPNLQQVTKALKPAFVPTPGYLIAEIDYSQIELRAAAFIANCEPMLQAYRDGQDLHTLMAAQITGKRPEDVTKDERQQGKAGDFGLLYGMQAEGFRIYAEDVYGVVLTDEEAAAVHDTFFRLWDGMAQWHQRCIAEAYETGQIVSPLGRVRRLPDIFSGDPRRRSHAERNAINSPVQGFASDLMQIAAASIEGRLPGTDPVAGVRLIGTVHDSILIEVPEDDWKRSTARCMHRMIGAGEQLRRLGCTLTVPLGAEATVGRRWGTGDVGVIVA